jgi:hypothetical protein
MVKLLELVLGVILFLGSSYGYFHSSNLVTQTQNFINNSTPQLFPKLIEDPSSNFLHVSNPAMEKIIRVTQYGFIVLAVSGLVLLAYGAVAKKQDLRPTKEKYHN